MEVDIYSDLDTIDNQYRKLQIENQQLKLVIQKLESLSKQFYHELTELKKIKRNLENNISALYKTAKTEIERKNREISDLRGQLDNMFFKRQSNYKYNENNSGDNQTLFKRYEEVKNTLEQKNRIISSLNNELTNVRKELSEKENSSKRCYESEANEYNSDVKRRKVQENEANRCEEVYSKYYGRRNSNDYDAFRLQSRSSNLHRHSNHRESVDLKYIKYPRDNEKYTVNKCCYPNKSKKKTYSKLNWNYKSYNDYNIEPSEVSLEYIRKNFVDADELDSTTESISYSNLERNDSNNLSPISIEKEPDLEEGELNTTNTNTDEMEINESTKTKEVEEKDNFEVNLTHCLDENLLNKDEVNQQKHKIKKTEKRIYSSSDEENEKHESNFEKNKQNLEIIKTEVSCESNITVQTVIEPSISAIKSNTTKIKLKRHNSEKVTITREKFEEIDNEKCNDKVSSVNELIPTVTIEKIINKGETTIQKYDNNKNFTTNKSEENFIKNKEENKSTETRSKSAISKAELKEKTNKEGIVSSFTSIMEEFEKNSNETDMHQISNIAKKSKSKSKKKVENVELKSTVNQNNTLEKDMNNIESNNSVMSSVTESKTKDVINEIELNCSKPALIQVVPSKDVKKNENELNTLKFDLNDDKCATDSKLNEIASSNNLKTELSVKNETESINCSKPTNNENKSVKNENESTNCSETAVIVDKIKQDVSIAPSLPKNSIENAEKIQNNSDISCHLSKDVMNNENPTKNNNCPGKSTRRRRCVITIT